MRGISFGIVKNLVKFRSPSPPGLRVSSEFGECEGSPIDGKAPLLFLESEMKFRWKIASPQELQKDLKPPMGWLGQALLATGNWKEDSPQFTI